MVETLRRRLKIGLTKRGRVDTKRVRRELLAAHIWREESFRVEMEKEGKVKRTKMTTAKRTETEEEDEKELEEKEMTRGMWEARQMTKEAEDTTLREMGFDARAESSSNIIGLLQ